MFDLDGTLVDSINDITNALNFALRPLRSKDLPPSEVAGMIGEGTVRLIERLIEKYNLPVDKRRLVGPFVEYYAAHLTDTTRPYPAVTETLQALKNYIKVVISNKYEAFTLKSLEKLGLSGYFEMVISGDTVPERKPSPAPILHVLSALHAEPREALMVGDSIVDIHAAKAASVQSVAVTYGYGSPGFHEQADFVIDTMSELTAIVQRMG